MRLLAAALALAVSVAPATADVVIRNHPGGNVIKTLFRKAAMEREGTRVRFAGRCDSACTVLLGLPSHQTCITERARFGFHRPFNTSRVAEVQAYMMAAYPGWVRNWISTNGGLTDRVITMDYSYAKRHMRTCT